MIDDIFIVKREIIVEEVIPVEIAEFGECFTADSAVIVEDGFLLMSWVSGFMIAVRAACQCCSCGSGCAEERASFHYVIRVY